MLPKAIVIIPSSSQCGGARLLWQENACPNYRERWVCLPARQGVAKKEALCSASFKYSAIAKLVVLF
jgi:hypothetical protein